MATHPLALALASVTTLAFAYFTKAPPAAPTPNLAYAVPVEIETVETLAATQLNRPIVPAWTPSQRHRTAERDLAAMLFGECRGDGIECMVAVANVAMNRARANLDGRYGRGLAGVINKRKAFSCMRRVDPNWRAIAKARAGKMDPHSPDGIAWTMALGQAHIAMHRGEPDPTHGATYYAVSSLRPYWIGDMRVTARIGSHTFYRLRAA